MLKKQNTVLVFLLLACSIAISQSEELLIKNFGIEDGLSQRDVFKVQQDEQGFLWVATRRGLDRYDGHRFAHWYSGDEKSYLPASAKHDLLLGQDHKMWLARGDDLLLIDADKNKADTVQWPKKGSPGQHIGSLCQDSLGQVWAIRFSPKGPSNSLLRSNKKGRFESIAQLPGGQQGIAVTCSGGRVYAGAGENEIWVFDLAGEQVGQFEFPAPPSDKGYSRTVQLHAGKDGKVWALLDHGQLFYLPPGGTSFVQHPLTESSDERLHSSSLLVARNGDIWMGGLIVSHSDDGESPCNSIRPGVALLHYNASTKRTEDLSYYLKQALPYAEPPRQIFEDKTGLIWISTTFGLIQLIENNLFERYMADGNDCCRDGVCSMRGITEDGQGNIYFSYYSSIHVLTPGPGSLVPLFSKQISVPFGILCDRGSIWTGEGLRIRLNTLEVDTVVGGMAGAEGVVMKDKDGELWFGCRRKLARYNPMTAKTTSFKDINGQFGNADFKNITYLLQGEKGGFIWVATKEGGFFKIKKNGGVLQHYDTQSLYTMPHNRILALLENKGQLWIASAFGLAKLDIATDSMEVFTMKDGLPNNFINGLLPEGDSAIWASTDNGLSRLDLRSGEFTNFFVSDGLSKNEFNRISFYRAKDGRMYFGGINGVNAFYPNARYGGQRRKMNCRLLLTDFTKFDGSKRIHRNWGLNNKKPIELHYHDRMFTFHFALADYADPKTHLYSYMLEGHDKVWSEGSPINFARYFNMPAGKYTFRARASLGGGNWVEDELAVPIVIRQVFYKKAWFQMAALGLLTLLVFGIMRYRLHAARKHELVLETLVQQRTRELATEKTKSDKLLLNILPTEIAEELKQFGAAKARRHENVTVMFTDFKEFSIRSKNMQPEELVAEIDLCYRAFDEITGEFGLEKIKTIGDAYMCSGGLKDDDKRDAAVRVVKAALKIQGFLSRLAEERRQQGGSCFEARIGIGSGPVVAGIVGSKKFAYDIWGDTVNIADRLQSNGEVGKVNISKSTYQLVKDHFKFTYRGKIAAKHLEEVDMYFVEG
ncbi:MAG TPA: hypothetical protein ENJ95_11575 [Bacteroidetes bacterium]|nr:hypothetical protein [Bacteroidota bacterium]